ncbi:MAG: hypothetical protein ACREJ3_20445 [Polyangiaceae bacterium]
MPPEYAIERAKLDYKHDQVIESGSSNVPSPPRWHREGPQGQTRRSCSMASDDEGGNLLDLAGSLVR